MGEVIAEIDYSKTVLSKLSVNDLGDYEKVKSPC